MLITAERDGYFGLRAKPALGHPRSESCEAERSNGLKSQVMVEIDVLYVAQSSLTASLREHIGDGALGGEKSSQKNKIINGC